MTHCQGQKGGQSPLSSVYYKKHNIGQKIFLGKIPVNLKKGVKSQKKILENFSENRGIYSIMKRIVKLTESDLTRIVKRIIKESNEKNYFKVFDKEGDLVWMGITTKGGEEERELIDKLHDGGYSMKSSNKEDFENFDYIKNAIPYIRKKFRGMKRENFERGSANWFDKEGKEVLQYHNRFFLVSEDIFIDVMEKFGLDERETKRVFSKYFDSKFPSLRHMGVEPN